MFFHGSADPPPRIHFTVLMKVFFLLQTRLKLDIWKGRDCIPAKKSTPTPPPLPSPLPNPLVPNPYILCSAMCTIGWAHLQIINNSCGKAEGATCCLGPLKGSVSRDFGPQFFSWFEPIWATDKQVNVFSNSVSISPRYSITKLSLQCVAHRGVQKIFLVYQYLYFKSVLS